MIMGGVIRMGKHDSGAVQVYTHNDDITTNNYITLDHDNKPHRRLSLTVLLPQMHILPIMQG